MENLKIEYRTEIRNPNIIIASVKNTKTGRYFRLGTYSTIDKAKYLAPKMLNHKIKTPSWEFKRFLTNK